MIMGKADFINKVTNVLGLLISKFEVLSNNVSEAIYNLIHWKYN